MRNPVTQFRRNSRLLVAVAIAGLAVAMAPAATSYADPILDRAIAAPDGSYLVSLVRGEGREATAEVYSAAMDKNIGLKLLIAPGDQPRPTVYVLDGVGGAGEENGLLSWGDAASFYKAKDVNVVATLGGDSSYYTDWQRDDPELGRNKWTTFLTEELPPIIDSALNTTGKNAIVGVSMSATSVLALSIQKPDLYEGVASFSGCAQTSDPLGRAYVYITVSNFGGNPVNMWGEPDDPAWQANDPYVHAAGLRGTALYISTGSGLPGEHDNLDAPNVDGETSQLVAQLTAGGVIEAATNQCTQNLRSRLDALGIPATYNFKDKGTHSWDYWRDDVHDSWPVLYESIR
ncbi:alpha/beta hydrolase family protein [Williamsia sp. D3]|uniref:alpha/beta hydrolase n=1 Tax=Williamsia sp. D3 TaxID=1313067 RepID=UPI0003D326EE|nr:alpha/beta hydrolase family protein [Williamsia sp. D3]ETD32366.1 esterase [Williamsia sp. D3]